MTRKNALVSCLPGRIRLRHPALRDKRCNARLATALSTLNEALTVEPNLTAGSVLFRYDPTRCDRRAMEARVGALCGRELGEPATAAEPAEERTGAADTPAPAAARRRSAAKQFNRLAKLAMLASFPLSLALAAQGEKRLHAVTGGAFTLFLLVHLIVHRRHLTQ